MGWHAINQVAKDAHDLNTVKPNFVAISNHVFDTPSGCLLYLTNSCYIEMSFCTRNVLKLQVYSLNMDTGMEHTMRAAQPRRDVFYGFSTVSPAAAELEL